MRTIYVDSDHHCHVVNDSTMTAVDTTFFDGKCDEFVEGYCYDTSKGAIYPWKPHSKLDAAQREYEMQLLMQYEKDLEELDAALLEAQYQSLIGGL